LAKSINKKARFKIPKFIDMLFLAGIAVVVVIVPLIVRLNGRDATSEEGIIKTGYVWDNFSYHKSLLLTATAVAVLIGIVMCLITREITFDARKFNKFIYIPSLIYCLFVILSTVFSQYKSTSVHGIMERYEGVYALISY